MGIKALPVDALCKVFHIFDKVKKVFSTRLGFKQFYWVSALIFLTCLNLEAQITGPEQDCDDAIPVCQLFYTQTQSYTGEGSVNDINGHSVCLQNDENNSVWYIFTVTDSGKLVFLIDPQLGDDYDFTLYNLTGGSCADIFNGTAVEVRCNYAFTNGPTGLQDGYTTFFSGPGDSAFNAPLIVNVGETYALLVDNFASTVFGYDLDFTASTASIADQTPPFINSVDSLTCDNASEVFITFSEPVLCSTLDSTGSDFQITGPSPVTVMGASSIQCLSGSFTLSATVTLSQPITIGGMYDIIISGSIEDNCGNQSSPDSVRSFFVPDIVDAGFSYTKASSCNADTFSFTSNVTGNVTGGYQWDFGDSITSTLMNPTHIYAAKDTYTVSLAVSSAHCTDTASQNVTVTFTSSPPIDYDPAVPCAGDSIDFTDLSFSNATNYVWRFGDGNISSEQNPTYAYAAPGFYDITFIIIDYNLGCFDTTYETIEVKENLDVSFSTVGAACVDNEVQFTDNSTGAPETWFWDFGDGGTSTDPNPTHTFNSVGPAPVQLIVDDEFCGTDTTLQNVDIQMLPNFQLGNDTDICLSESVVLSAYPGADSYNWSTGATTQTIEFDDVPGMVWAIATLNGCSYSDTIIIDERTIDCSFAKVPTAFSPNGDSYNDILKVLTKRVAEFELIIYNRWGEEVYRNKNNEGLGWDGTFKDEPLDIGTYTYVLTWRAINNERYTQSGNITLVR